jgi:NAD(P)H-dependent flavin oxidoreductase YrpB (nitropropane dioxygenase family)
VELKQPDDKAMNPEDARIKLDLCFKHEVEVIACAMGTPKWVVDECHSRGIKVIGMAGKASHARAALESGADVVVVQGREAGGHTGDVGLVTLLAEVLEFSTVPVAAAGGIVNGAQIAGLLTHGAQGVWVGTRFIGTHEASVGDNYKQAILDAGYDGTVRSLPFDGLSVRMLRNRFTDVWEGHEHEILPYPLQRVAVGPLRFAAAAADLRDYQAMPAGQGSSMVRDILPAGELVQRLVKEAIAALRASRERVQIDGVADEVKA